MRVEWKSGRTTVFPLRDYGKAFVLGYATTDKGAMNGAALAIKVDAFGAPDQFANHIADLGQRLKALPKAPDTDEILLPGERGFRLSEVRMREGIPVADGTLARLASLGERFDVAPPVEIKTDGADS